MHEERIRIYKLPMSKIIANKNNIEHYTDEEAIMNGELVPISGSQLTGKISDYYDENQMDGLRIRDAIINIVVPSSSGHQTKKVADDYRKIANSGFYVNGKHYIRLCAGSGQLRNNTVTYVWDVMYGYLIEALCCGITPQCLGESFSVSKWNAYVGLSESGMRFLKTMPQVCIVSDYEEIKPHFPIDYIETENITGRKNKKVNKTITRHYYDDEYMNFPPLNSFDGQGLADPTWMKNVAIELGYLSDENGYVPSEYILRAPWCKGLVVAFDFKEYCKEYGIDTITDVYGQPYRIDDIDILLTTSQFKMWKAYKELGGWRYHQDSMKKYNLHWGVVIANKERDDDFRALNYQYIQALDLTDEDINELCKDTERQLTNLCTGDIESVYKTLIGFSDYVDGELQDCSDTDVNANKPYESLLQKAVTHNPDLLNDAYIQTLIYREVESKFNGAKIGKLLCRGGYSFIVSDPVAQIQHIIKAHATNKDITVDVNGLIPAHMIYSNYWNHASPKPDKVVLMRSPLVDSSEVTVCKLINNPETDKWYSHIKSGLILSIFDLNTLALQNCDFDGDRCFSSDNQTLIKGAQDNPVPILYPSAGAQLKGAITFESIIEADVRGLNSAVGGLSNQATSLYALRDNFTKDSPEYEELSRRIKIISELVGVEIDKIKTGIPPTKPSAWSKERIPYEQYDSGGNVMLKVPACSLEEQERIKRHNALIPESKPLFMRYIYESLNKDLIKYDKAFDSVNKYNNGIGLAELISSDYDSLDDDKRALLDRYYKFFPAINTPCNMNKICKRFEHLQKKLKQQKSSRNMLIEYATGLPTNQTVLEEIAKMIDVFQRQKRFITRSNNISCTDSNKQIAKNTGERLDILQTYIRDKILDIANGSLEEVYNCLSELMKEGRCAESSAWAILDDMVLYIIPYRPYQKEAV